MIMPLRIQTPPDRIGLMVSTSHPQVIGMVRGNPEILGHIFWILRDGRKGSFDGGHGKQHRPSHWRYSCHIGHAGATSTVTGGTERCQLSWDAGFFGGKKTEEKRCRNMI